MSQDALFASALELHASGRVTESVQAYRGVLAEHPDHPAALNNLSLALHALGRLDEAVMLFRRLLARDPANAEAQCNLGAVLRQQGRLDAAVAAYRAALEVRPNYPEAHSNLGNVLRQQCRYAAAVASLRRAVELKPDFAEAHDGLGAALQEQGSVMEAVAAYRRAIEERPGFWQAHAHLALALDWLSQYAEAVEEYRRALAIKEDARTRVFLAGALLSQGKVEEARMEARQAIGQHDEPSFPHFDLGLLYARLGLKDGAKTQLLRYLEQDPEDARGAGLLLAKLGFRDLPKRASRAMIHRLYARTAENWDRRALSQRGYRAHLLVGQAFARMFPGATALDVLDAGCGTGLIDPGIVASARVLDGVDLSEEMLEHADIKGLYTDLHEGDLVDFLSSRPAAYDAVVSAATLVHFGDLSPVFAAAGRALRPGGCLIFTVFPNEDPNAIAAGDLDAMAEGRCFVHGEEYVRRTAMASRFDVESIVTDVDEYADGRKPRLSLVVTLRLRRDT